MERILKARLKEVPQCAIRLDVDFGENWLAGSALIERAKREMLSKLKNDMHEKIAVLSLEDIEFQILKA